MMLTVCVKESVVSNITNIAAQTVGTGFMGTGGNKGGVAIRLEINRTSICFVCSHLAAHLEEQNRRNQDYQDICKRLSFNQFNPPMKITDHDMIFWMGDLNYRIEDFDATQVKNMLVNNKIDELLAADQLRQQRNLGNVFAGKALE